jgi:hypothetical protein
MEGDSAASVYSDTKAEYTTQLTRAIVPVFHRFFMGCLNQAAEEEPQAKRQLWKFQEILSQVPEWNVDKVGRETAKIQSEIQCDFLEELVTAVFIAHTKILTAIRIGNKNKRVQITIPKLDHFLHRALSESARLLWSSAYLFHNDLPPIEKQKNHRQIEQLLHEGIAQAIRGLLPVKNILKEYLAEPESTAEEADDDGDEDEKEEKEEKKQSKEEKTEEKVEEKAEEKKPEDTIPEVKVESEPAVADVAEVKLEAVVAEPELQAPVAVAEVKETTPVVIKEEAPVPTPVPTPTPVPAPERPTLVVETEPSVRFTDWNQVIQTRSGETQIDYVETDHEPKEEDETVNFMDDEGEPLSDFEVLEDSPAEALDADDFETLP